MAHWNGLKHMRSALWRLHSLLAALELRGKLMVKDESHMAADQWPTVVDVLAGITMTMVGDVHDGEALDYERMETLGDSVLKFITTAYLYFRCVGGVEVVAPVYVWLHAHAYIHTYILSFSCVCCFIHAHLLFFSIHTNTLSLFTHTHTHTHTLTPSSPPHTPTATPISLKVNSVSQNTTSYPTTTYGYAPAPASLYKTTFVPFPFHSPP